MYHVLSFSKQHLKGNFGKKVMITKRYSKLNKIRLSRWVDTPLDQILFKKISNLDLR
jgi:hypothetical protein